MSCTSPDDPLLIEIREHLKAVHPRQTQIENNQVESVLANLSQRGSAVGGGCWGKSRGSQHRDQSVPQCPVVIDNQHRFVPRLVRRNLLP